MSVVTSPNETATDRASGARSPEWRVGWSVVFGTALGLGTGHSLYNFVSSLFVLPLSAEFGWTRGEIATATATGLVGAFAAPLIGRMADRYGVRPVITLSILGLALAYAALATMQGQLYVFYISIAALGIAGLGTTGITYTRVIVGWFERSRGFALGVSLTGVSLFAALVPPLLSTLIGDAGWRVGYLLLAGMALLIGLPAMLTLVRERPSARPKSHGAKTTPWRAILTSPPFWLLLVGMIAINVPGNGMLGQLQPLLTDRGLGMQQAALMLTVYAVSVLVGRLVLGFLLDKISAPVMAAISVTLPALGAAALIGDSTTLLTASIAVALLGLSQGVEMDLTAFFIARFFGMRHYSMLFAAIISGLVLANATGALMFGRIYDATGSYDTALAVGTVLFVIGGACILALRWCKPSEAFAHDNG